MEGLPNIAEQSAYPAAVVITTRNRKDDLRKAIDSVLAQSVQVEIVIFDDGSSDGTAEMVSREYPQARLYRSERSLGIVEARNRAIAMAASPIVITIDDDCVFATEEIIRQTLADFDHPRIGAVAIPSIDIYSGHRAHGPAPDGQNIYVCSEFRGGANAMRRDLFLALGSYRGFLFRQGEEADYALRLLDAGYVIRIGRAQPIHHFEHPTRNIPRIVYYTVRSNILYTWYNVPMPYFPVHLAATTVNCLCAGFRYRCPWSAARGLVSGYGGMIRQLTGRRPVQGRSYRLLRRLRGRVVPLREIEQELPPMRHLC